MGAIHNDSRVAWAQKTVLVQAERCLFQVRVAVDLDDEGEMRCVIAHVASFIRHDDAEGGIVLTDEGQSAWLLFTVHLHLRQVVARVVRINDVGVVDLQVGTPSLSLLTKVELDG